MTSQQTYEEQVNGYETRDWKKAKEQCVEILADIAKSRGRIAYSELAPRIQGIQFDYDDPRFWHLLAEISVEEMREGRGMLSAIVVHKTGEMRPGPGFYEVAKWLGKRFGEADRFWLAEFNNVHDVWANRRGVGRYQNTEVPSQARHPPIT